MFQSLLCWIMVCKLTFFGLAFLALTCFNPCYVGLWSVRVSTVFGGFCLACFNPCYVGLWSVSWLEKLLECLFSLFQSLLCWIMVCKPERLTIPIRSGTLSFNPCYVGLWSVSLRFHPLIHPPAIEFQSLLCWIMVCKKFIANYDCVFD